MGKVESMLGMAEQTFKGARLRQWRLRSGLTQGELATRVGTHTNQIYRYENEETEPNTKALVSIARELGVTTDWLLGLVDDPTQRLQNDDLSEAEKKLLTAYRRGDVKLTMKLVLDDNNGK